MWSGSSRGQQIALATALTVGGISVVAYLLRRRKEWLEQILGNRRWFSELSEFWPGQCCSLEVDKVIYSGRSKLQDILVFDSKTYGRVLVLDNVIQATERDEFAYQEMMTHIPMFSHAIPQKVLVIGGGDGGILREVSRHPGVLEIHICEIDSQVIQVAKRYMRQLSVGFDDPRVQVHIEDGAKFLESHKGEFDVVIVDSSDPIGPSASLFRPEFYETLSSCLKADGIAATQGESYWLHGKVIEDVYSAACERFAHVNYAQISIPTYPSGEIGVMCCSKGGAASCVSPVRFPDREMSEELGYYTPEVHAAAFVLPAFAKRMFNRDTASTTVDVGEVKISTDKREDDDEVSCAAYTAEQGSKAKKKNKKRKN